MLFKGEMLLRRGLDEMRQVFFRLLCRWCNTHAGKTVEEHVTFVFQDTVVGRDIVLPVSFNWRSCDIVRGFVDCTRNSICGAVTGFTKRRTIHFGRLNLIATNFQEIRYMSGVHLCTSLRKRRVIHSFESHTRLLFRNIEAGSDAACAECGHLDVTSKYR